MEPPPPPPPPPPQVTPLDDQTGSDDPLAKTKGTKKKNRSGSEKHRRKVAKVLEHAGQDAWFWKEGSVPKMRNPHDERRARRIGPQLSQMW